MVTGAIRGPRNVVGGLVLVLFCVAAQLALGDLDMGSMLMIGPGLVPKVVAWLIGAGGLILIVQGMLKTGEPLDGWQLRGPVLMTAALLIFAATIRAPGFLIGAPATMIVAGFGSTENKLREVLIFAAVMTVFCIILFRFLLGQPLVILNIPYTSVRI